MTTNNDKDKVFVTIGLTQDQWRFLVPKELESGSSVNDNIKALINKAINENR